MQRNGQKRDILFLEGKKRQEQVFFSQLFWQKYFGMDFPPEVVLVFLNSPC
jgi:hypothetical protein